MDEEINLSDSTIGDALKVVKEISAVQNESRLSRGVAFGTPAAPQPLAPNFKPEVQVGDSLWSILNKILSTRISGLDKAGQIFVLSTIADIVLKSKGSILVGDKLDFSPIFADEQKIKSILDRASKLGEAQKTSILENNKKISDWLSVNPTTEINLSKVSEILAAKPTQPIQRAEMPKVMPLPNPPKIPSPVSIPIPTPIPKPTLTSIPVTPVATAVKSLMTDASIIVAVDKAFKDEINAIYGKSGFLKKIPGTETEEWLFVKSLPVLKVLKYFTGDSTNSGLNPKDAEQLAKSPKHQELVKQIAGLMKETREIIKPYESETVEQFLKRLGKYVMENHLT